MRYIYFVSYSFGDGEGQAEFISNKLIDSIDDISRISNKLEEKINKDVVILNFILLRTEKID